MVCRYLKTEYKESFGREELKIKGIMQKKKKKERMTKNVRFLRWSGAGGTHSTGRE